MPTYYFLGKYSPDALTGISAARTEECVGAIKELGGEVVSMNALLGEYDLVLVINLSSNADAVKASLKLTQVTGISFTTCPAVSVDEFDQVAGSL